MRLFHQEANNLAVLTGIKNKTLSRFLKKFDINLINNKELDPWIHNHIRRDTIAAVSDYQEFDLQQESSITQPLIEETNPSEFFTSKHGKAILIRLKKNGHVFSRELIKQYFDNLNPKVFRWARMIDLIARDLGLNFVQYNTYQEQENDMLNKIELLHSEYLLQRNKK